MRSTDPVAIPTLGTYPWMIISKSVSSTLLPSRLNCAHDIDLQSRNLRSKRYFMDTTQTSYGAI